VIIFLSNVTVLNTMTEQERFGKFKSITIFDDNRKGEIILRTPAGDLTLELSDDNDSAFGGMTAVASAGVEFATGDPAVAPNIHVKYDDSDMEIDEMTLHYH
jgi:hypothetical protein